MRKLLRCIKNFFYGPEFAVYTLIDARDYARDKFYSILTVKENDKVVEFLGGYTVWHRIPGMKRCSSRLERILSDFEALAKYEGKLK